MPNILIFSCYKISQLKNYKSSNIDKFKENEHNPYKMKLWFYVQREK